MLKPGGIQATEINGVEHPKRRPAPGMGTTGSGAQTNLLHKLYPHRTTPWAQAPKLGRMKTNLICNCLAPALGLAQLLTLTAAAIDKAAPLSTFGKLPIKEITVFKDGHAFVAHEGTMPTDEHGDVLMDYLPTPVIGTFWPYAAEKAARLVSVVAGQKRVLIEHTALSLRELLEANIGAEAIIAETGGNRYGATILGLPARSSEEQAATGPPNSGERLPEKGNLVLLKTAEGVKVLGLDRIQDVIFTHGHKTAAASEEFRNLMRLHLDWGSAKPAGTANVGLFYLQKGVRWIPSYKVELDGKGNAAVKLEATLLNELADLDDVSVNLVIGVPTFAFKDTIDPMALQQSLAQLSQYFQTDSSGRNSPLAYNFSNAIMSQQAVRMSDFRGPAASGTGGDLGPEIGDSGKTEDLFIFNLPHVRLKRGERMAVEVAEFTLPYKDLFTLELPFGPPPEVRANLNNEQQRELARLFSAPKVMHKVRLTNTSKYPLTTAPALTIRAGRVLAQGMMTYTAAGASVDLAITTAVDFQARKSDTETKRTPNAAEENGNRYTRVDLTGKISVTSHRAQPAELEITRYVLGAADSGEENGKVEKINIFENNDYFTNAEYPYWWSWYGWPHWWNYFNGIGRVTWKVTLEPNQSKDLGYQWHYFWR
jgi:hypothetical protein